MISREQFVAQVMAIEAESPRYELGGDGSNGVCDCIGLVIGAIRRAGGTWTGTHGSNWAARRAVGNLRPVSSASALHRGEVVFKAREPGEDGYALPSAYAGDADARDYYHVGVVLSGDPLLIVHCTRPTVRRDDALGRWAYAAELLAVNYDDETRPAEMTAPALYYASVATERDPLRMRAAPVDGEVVYKVPRGAIVAVLDETHEGWPLVRCGAHAGYVSAQYLRYACGPSDADVSAGSGTTAGSGTADSGTGSDGSAANGSAVTGVSVVITDDAGHEFYPTGGWTVRLRPVAAATSDDAARAAGSATVADVRQSMGVD